MFYKFEMNFQIRSFGMKDAADVESLSQYLDNLSELTMFLIKNGDQGLRDTAVHLLAGWNRVIMEIKNQDLKWEANIRKQVIDIILLYIENWISDMKEDNEDEDEEQFNDAELNSLTQRFEIIGRLWNVDLKAAVQRISEGLAFLMSNYEEQLKNGNYEKLRVLEIRFSWVIRVITAIIGLGVSSMKYSDKEEYTNEYDIWIKIVDIIRLNVQLWMDQTRKMDEKLELSILNFMAWFRANILADPKVVSRVTEADDSSIFRSDGYLRISDKITAKDAIDVTEVFLNKIILNFYMDSETIVEQNLDILKNFASSYCTQKLLNQIETTQDLITNHFTKFVFLNKGNMYDYLSGFYKVLTIFWEVNDTIDNFNKYMKPCTEFLDGILTLDSKSFIRNKDDILRVCYILTGAAQGFTTPESFSQFFDWLYPGNFRLIEAVFKHFIDDKIVIKALFKLMAELLDNKTHRLKSDQSSMSGFLLFKEVSSIMIEYLKFVELFEHLKIKNDKYEEKYQFIEMSIEIFGNIVSGSYVNFSIWEYYNDTTFIDLSRLIFTLITIQDQKEYSSFTRLTQITHGMIENFMKHHSILMMKHFEPTLIIKVLETTLLGLMTENESKGWWWNGLKDFWTVIYLSREKLADKIGDLISAEASIFRDVLKTLLTTVIYEEHKVIWVFQKPLFPTIIINGKEDFEAVKEEILAAENNKELRNKIKTELDLLWDNVDFRHDKYNREKFSSNFSRFKNNLVKFK